MKSKKFPTKTQFIQWWDSKWDIRREEESRSASCPIARYLKDTKKTKYVYVGSEVFEYDIGEKRVEGYLPNWAMEFVRAADKQFKQGRYRGLPKGFK
jgi:hypothetical protein